MSILVICANINDEIVDDHCDQCRVFVFRIDGDTNQRFSLLSKSMRVTCPKCNKTFQVERKMWWECDTLTMPCNQLNNFPVLSGIRNNAILAEVPDITDSVLKFKVESLNEEIGKLTKMRNDILATINKS